MDQKLFQFILYINEKSADMVATGYPERLVSEYMKMGAIFGAVFIVSLIVLIICYRHERVALLMVSLFLTIMGFTFAMAGFINAYKWHDEPVRNTITKCVEIETEDLDDTVYYYGGWDQYEKDLQGD